MKVRRRLGLVAGALGALIVTWIVSGHGAVPIYDSFLLPSGPYHYLKPPPSVSNNIQPKPVSTMIRVSAGKVFPLSIVYTPETIPQARLDLLDGAFKVPAAATHVIASIRPVSPPSPLPTGLEAASNVYRFQAETNTGVALTPVKGKASVDLLAARRHGTPFIDQYRNGGWVGLATGQFVGVQVYSAPVTSLGDFVLVTRGGPVASSSGSNVLRTALIAVAAGLLVVAAAILLVWGRRRSSDEARA